MKTTLWLTLAAAMWLAGCAARQDTQQFGKATHPVYESAEQIRAMPPCKARVVQREPCSVFFKTAEGKGFYVGSPGSTAEVGRFLGLLKEGQRYDFPEAYLNYQRNRPAEEP